MIVKFNELPEEVRTEVMNTLRAYDKIDVCYENGMYHYGAFIKRNYAPDFKTIGTYRADEIYTPEERIINYVEEFHSYPIEYKGKRSYQWLNTLTWESKVTFDNDGNLITA